MYQLVLVRFGEIALKGHNRRYFERALLHGIKRNLRGLKERPVHLVQGRVIVPLEGDWEEVSERLATVCGVVSFSPARKVPNDMEAIKEAALEEMIAAGYGECSFKVDSRRADKSFHLTSPEINREVGGFVLSRLPKLTVDVHSPEHRLMVEVRREGSYVYTQVIEGTGGLPYGVSGKAVLLLSGGIDSPVAGYMAARRGVDLIPLHFYSFPFTGERSREKVIDLCRVLSRYGKDLDLHIAHFTEIQKAIGEKCPEALRITIMRRMMLRVAERVAEAEGALAIVTGDCLGQVASQTMESLAVIGAVASRPILRPLIGMDKADIVVYARRLGTYPISIRPYEDCCTLFVPPHPAIRPRLERAEEAERELEVDSLIEECLERTEVVAIPPQFRGGAA